MKKFVCERKRCCATCVLLVMDARHECNKVFCVNCKQKSDVGHLCYMRPLNYALPDASDKVLYVFYDFETTQNTHYTDKATLLYHISSAFSNSVRSAKMRKTVKSAGDAVRGGTRSGTTR